MASQKPGFLPMEILVRVAGMINGVEMDDNDSEDIRAMRGRQTTLYHFCLVNHQWYSAGIEQLYIYPMLWTGNSFERFIRTICPPRMSKKKSQKNLNTMIQYLDLRKLVHHSSNSVTARLIHEASQNLVVFRAPRFSFSVNCLASLSKCSNLVSLDLTLVNDSRMGFAQLKKAISKLENLRKLTLPAHMQMATTRDLNTRWPPNLVELTIGGNIAEYATSRFDWPANMRTLSITKSQLLTHTVMQGIQESLLNSDSVPMTLENLLIEDDGQWMLSDVFRDPIDSLWAFSNLSTLRIPIKMAVYFHLINSPPYDLQNYLPLPALAAVTIITESVYPEVDTNGFKSAFMWSLRSGPLSGLWFLELPSPFIRRYGLDTEEIDGIIMANLEEVGDEELDRWGLPPGLNVA